MGQALASRATRNAAWWWRLAAADRRWLQAGAAGSAVLVAVAAALAYGQHQQQGALAGQLAAALAQRALINQQAASAALAAASAPQPWWASLPHARPGEQRPAEERLAADVWATAQPLGVQVQRLTMAPQARADGAPYRATAVSVELKGNYPELKRWLGELLARQPQSLALKSIDWRRAADPAASGVEASVELRLFERVEGPSP